MFANGPHTKNDKSVSRLSDFCGNEKQVTLPITEPVKEPNATFTIQTLLARINLRLNNHHSNPNPYHKTIPNVRVTTKTNQASESCSGQNCTASNDKITDDESKHRHLESARNQDRLRSLGDSLEGQAKNWVPSIKNTLQRSLSLQCGSKLIAKEQTPVHAKHEQATNNSPGHKSSRVDKRIKCILSTHISKYDSWLVNNGVKAATSFFGSIFLLLLLSMLMISFASLTTEAASIPPPAIQPIWLRDGLITIGQESIEDEPTEESAAVVDLHQGPLDRLSLQLRSDNAPFGSQQQQQVESYSPTGYAEITNEELARILSEGAPRKKAPSSSPLVLGRIPWFQIATDQPEKKNHDDEGQSEELFWIERRRLERDRALEPPPWLREQPMRRNIAPLMQVPKPATIADPDEEIAVEIPRTGEPSDADDLLSGQRPNRGRQSRQSADQIYESLLKLLAEGTYGTGSFLENLQAELELRNKANQRLQKAQYANENGVGDNEMPMQLQKSHKQQHSQLIGQNGQVQIDTQETLGMGQEPDATLVVAGDEVSSGDDGETTIEVDQGSKQTSAAYTLPGSPNVDEEVNQAANSETAYGNAFGTSLLGLAYPTNQVPMKSQPLVEGFIARPDGAERLISSVDLGASPIALIEQQQQQLVASPSFHVIEDIDQMDNSQDNSEINEHPSFSFGSTGDMSVTQQHQQQQQPDTNNWDSQTEVNNQPMKGLQSKRSVLLRPVLAKDLQQLRNFNKASPTSWHEEVQTGRLLLPMRQPPKASDQNLAISPFDFGELSEEQLARTRNKFLAYLEDTIGLERGSILGFYPLSNNKLLIKMDTTIENPRFALTMFKKFGSMDFARGYIVVTWPAASRENPVALLSAILREMAKHDEIDDSAAVSGPTTTTVDNDNGDDDRTLEASEVSMAPIAQQPYSGLAGPDGSGQQAAKLIRFGNQYWLARGKPGQQTEIEPSIQMGSSVNADQSLFDGGGRLSLAALANYLSALYAVDQLSASKYGANVQVGPSIIVPTSEKMAASATKKTRSANDADYQRYLVYLTISMGALLCMYITYKLIIRGKPRRALRRRFRHNETLRSLWSESSDGDDIIDNDDGQITASNSSPGRVLNHHQQTQGKGIDLQAGNPLAANRRQLSDDSGLVSNMDSGTDKRSSSSQTAGIDVLAQRLINLLRYHHHYKRHKDSQLSGDDLLYKSGKGGKRQIDKDKKELDEVSADNDYFDEIDESDQHHGKRAQHFRSSNSYIKSLIDVLSKARAQFPSSNQSNYSSKPTRSSKNTSTSERAPLTACDTLDQQSATDEMEAEESAKQQQIDEDLTGAGVAMSQMDISAAHLILAYMEKHLEDREQLRREWLDLNGAVPSLAPALATAAPAGNKIVQLTLQKLAKVALSEENRAKNRNCLVVPFDRNRVRLAVATTANADGAQLSAKGINSKQSRQQKQVPSDYINASYIYDDDLRKPTHIIAQGPTEQTCGQFWQMVWEQGISVIVMLTRLSENSTQMCHCYWPKDNSSATPDVVATTTLNPQPVRSSLNPSGPGDSSTNREPTPADQKAAFWRDDPISGVGAGATLASPAPAAAAAVGALVGSSSPTTTNGCRRVSVTSVFNTLEARQNGNGQPIVANGDLSNNTICFDVDSSNSPDGKCTRFEVHLVSEHVSSNDYLVRNMYMINRSTGETRTITQFHYLAWPESGVPDNVKSFLAFRRKVHKSYRNLKSPILVHCSDGGGRSGTYTLIDIILERIKNGAKEIDPRATLEHLRDQRVGLCGTQSQFEFVSVALAEEIQIILNALPK